MSENKFNVDNVTAGLGYMNTAIGAYGDYAVAKIQYQMQEAARKHREKMGQISLTLQRNAMTDNEVAVRDANVRASAAIGLTSQRDKAQAELQAAASGVAGVSVDGTARGLEQSFLRAHNARKRNTASQQRSMGKDRLNMELAHIFGRDMSINMKPSGAAAALGLGVTLVRQYDNNQPEGSRIADTLSRLNS